MSLLYVTEFASLTPTEEGGSAQVARVPALVDQTPVNYSGGAASSAAFNKETKYVRIHTDAICSIAFGVSPTATTSNMRMIAGQTEYFGVTPGMKVSAVINT